MKSSITYRSGRKTKKIKNLLPGYSDTKAYKEEQRNENPDKSEKVRKLDQKFNRMFTN